MRLFFVPLIACVLLSCQKQKMVSQEELKKYILDPENGLIVKAKKNDVDIEALYRPNALVIAQQIDGVTDKAERTKVIKNFDSLTYFVIKLSRNGQEIENGYVFDPDKFLKVANYLASGVAQNIYLTTSTDTIPALDAVYTRMFGAATATTVMAIFDADVRELTGTLQLHLDDTELGLGLNEFEFDTNNIKNAPTLNLN